jgi:hypothetical protein
VRGGSWNNNRQNARCAYRNRNVPDNFNDNLGFRVASHDSQGAADKAGLLASNGEAIIERQRCPVPAAAFQPSETLSQI